MQNTSFDFDNRRPIRSSWNEAKLVIGKKLTDKKISNYEKRGYYSEDFKQARREMWARKAAKQATRRSGNFIERDGRLIYSP